MIPVVRTSRKCFSQAKSENDIKIKNLYGKIFKKLFPKYGVCEYRQHAI